MLSYCRHLSQLSLALAVCATALLSETLGQGDELPPPPWILGHRGSAGSLPEHTAEGYLLGIAQGAHFIECDVVLTKDCVPVCRHEPDVSGTTDALHKFPHLVRNETIDGTEIRGIFTVDLTLSQLKTLRAKERIATRTVNAEYNYFYQIPTLQEYLDIIKAADHSVGAIPEIKHGTWFGRQNLPCLQGKNISSILLQVLQDNGYAAALNTSAWRRRPVIIQSFEITNLQWLASVSEIPLMQLLDESDYDTADELHKSYGDMMTDQGLADIAAYAQILGPWKESIMPTDGSAPEAVAVDLVRRAHDHGLLVGPYTFRIDDPWNATEQADGAPDEEFEYFLEVQQCDALFTDFPAEMAYVLQLLNTTEVPIQDIALPVATEQAGRR